VKRQRWRAWILAAWCAAAAACGGADRGARPGRQVRVAAASDLSVALGELTARLTAVRGIEAAVSYGSSGVLFSQLSNGAPFDVFLSADEDYPRRLVERGLTAGGPFAYGVGRLVIWTSDPSKVDVQRRGLRSLADAAVRHVAIANPQHAPYGRAAVAALRAAGVYDAVEPRLVYGENVAQALQFVQSGSADAGLVALALALAPGARDQGTWVEVPAPDYPPLRQAGVIMNSAADAGAAEAFRDFLLGADGRAILERHGFAAPER